MVNQAFSLVDNELNRWKSKQKSLKKYKILWYNGQSSFFLTSISFNLNTKLVFLFVEINTKFVALLTLGWKISKTIFKLV